MQRAPLSLSLSLCPCKAYTPLSLGQLVGPQRSAAHLTACGADYVCRQLAAVSGTGRLPVVGVLRPASLRGIPGTTEPAVSRLPHDRATEMFHELIPIHSAAAAAAARDRMRPIAECLPRPRCRMRRLVLLARPQQVLTDRPMQRSTTLYQ